MKLGFVIGLIVGLLLIPAGAYLLFYRRLCPGGDFGPADAVREDAGA